MRKVFSIFLIILVFSTNVVGLTVNTHFCGEKAVVTSVSIGKDNVSCGMNNATASCPIHSGKTHFSKKSCCENKYTQASIDRNYNKSDIRLNTLMNCLVLLNQPVLDFLIGNFNKIEYLNYSPPLLSLDIPVQIQSFLI